MVTQLTVPGSAHVAFRHRTSILGWLFGVTLLAVAYCLLATPEYQGSERLVVTFTPMHTGDPGNAQQQSAPTTSPPDREIINSYVLELQGVDLARDVIQTIGRSRVYPDSKGSFHLTDPADWFGILQEQQGSPVERAVKRFTEKDLDVEVAPDSDVINVSFLNPDREVAQQAVGLLVGRFLEREAKVGRNPRLGFAEKQVNLYRRKMAEAQASMQAFSLRHGITSLDDEQKALLQQRSSQEKLFNATRSHIAEDTPKVTALKVALSRLSPMVTDKTEDRDPLVETVRSYIGKLLATQGELTEVYRDDSSAVSGVRHEIQAALRVLSGVGARRTLSSTVPNLTYQQTQQALIQAEADLAAATDNAATQQRQLDVIKSRLAVEETEQGTYHNLVREYQLADRNYRTYAQGVQQARLDDDLNKERISRISVFDPATAAIEPAQPRVLLVIALGALSGLAIGFGLAFVLEGIDERMNLPEHVTGALGIPLLASMGTLSIEHARPLPGLPASGYPAALVGSSGRLPSERR